jgi:hypothetical protein
VERQENRGQTRSLIVKNPADGPSDPLRAALPTLAQILDSFSKAANHLLCLLRLAIQAARRSRSLTDMSIQASFNLGQLEGIWRIFRMPPARRNELLGRARSH